MHYLILFFSVLVKTDQKERKDPEDDDTLSINTSFDSRLQRMKVPFFFLILTRFDVLLCSFGCEGSIGTAEEFEPA